MTDARTYLQNARIEEALASAVSKIIEERPENPIDRISEVLYENMIMSKTPMIDNVTSTSKVWVVTGSNAGMGLKLCSLLLVKKHTVYALCRRASPELTALAAKGVNVVEGVDLSGDVSFLKTKFNNITIDVLVNNAAVFDKDGSILATAMGSATQATETATVENLRYVYEVNTFGPVKLVQLLLPNMKSPGGKIANLSTIGGSLKRNSMTRAVPPPGGWLAYGGSKAALNFISRSMAVDLAPKGISVVIIHPGVMSTNLFLGDIPEVPDPAKGITFSPEDSAEGVYKSINWCSMENTGAYVDALNYSVTKNTDPGSNTFIVPF